MTEKPLCGFVSAVLSRPMHLMTANNEGFAIPVIGNYEGIFLISNRSPKPTKPKATANRKYISYSDTYKHGRSQYAVNAKPTGIYTGMLSKAINQIDIAQQIWKRVLTVRIDLHQSEYTADSKNVSWFFKKMVRKLKSHYKTEQVGYFWVREQERAKSQHYHVWLFLDGGKVKHSSVVIKMAKRVWVENWAGQHHIPTTKKPFRLISSEEVKQEVVYWISYACKGRGKGYRPPQSKDYGASRLKLTK